MPNFEGFDTSDFETLRTKNIQSSLKKLSITKLESLFSNHAFQSSKQNAKKYYENKIKFLGRKIRRITLWFDKFLDAIMVEYDIKLGIKSTKHGTGSKNSKSRTIYISSNDHVRQVNGK